MWPVEYICGNHCEAVIPVLSTFAFMLVTYGAFKYLFSDAKLPFKPYRQRHNWQSIQASARAWYCSICKTLIVSGFGVYCDCCGICADQECISQALLLKCKTSTDVELEDELMHQWIEGNLPMGAVCYVCDRDCSVKLGLVDYQCCWCHLCVHTHCRETTELRCNLGQYRPLIVPPWTARVKKNATSAERFSSLDPFTIPQWEDWKPVLVISNCKSGSGDGDLLMSELRGLLNPFQVADLSETPPEAILSWIKLVRPVKLNLLVAGGDGTVAWILNEVHKLQIMPVPAVAIVPLGTGNDLSRVLGWGNAYYSDTDARDLLQQVMDAEPQPLDRWRVDIAPFRPLGLRIPSKKVFMYNYFSLGVDAQVALDFHRTRESRLYLFSNRLFNKILYLCYGTQQVVAAGCKNLDKRVEVFLDGYKVKLPELEAIVVLNIPSWGAGVDLWSKIREPAMTRQSYNDGVLEVVGIYSSFQMAQLQIGLTSPYCIGQASEVQIRLLAPSAVQIDGEPWEQGPAIINITRQDQAEVLVNRKLLNMQPLS